MSTSGRPYHHADLRATLIAGAIELLEAGEPYSLRAVARHVGVSPTAPYRHFADRQALDSAIAAESFTRLQAALTDVLDAAPADEPAADLLADLGVAYVRFALDHPAVFHVMFGGPCDPADSDRVQASQALHALLRDVLVHTLPDQASPALATALWGLAHGLACLHLDGKYRPGPGAEVADRVRAAFAAMLTARVG
jgi:AcrR family transcriptional regulator